MKNSLNKHERIKSRKLIERIFRSGSKIKRYPLLLLYLPVDEVPHKSNGILFGVTVSKRKIRNAVTRNLIKRRIRETYRQEKQSLIDHLPKNHAGQALFFVYLSDKPLEYPDISEAMKHLTRKLKNRWSNY